MPEMSTKRLMKLVARYNAAHLAEKAAEGEKKTLAAKIIPELKRRGTRALDALGWKVTHVEQKMTVYDVAKAKEILPAKTYKKITQDQITSDLVNEAMAAGDLTPRQLAKFSKRVTKSSYILANPSSDSGDDD